MTNPLTDLPLDWTREQFDEMLDRIRTARAIRYYRIMRPRKDRDLSGLVTTTNLPEQDWDGEDRRTREREPK